MSNLFKRKNKLGKLVKVKRRHEMDAITITVDIGFVRRFWYLLTNWFTYLFFGKIRW